MYTIICTSDNPPSLHSEYVTEESAKQVLKALQEIEYESVMKQTITLYGEKYYLGIHKERLTGNKNSIVFKKFEINATVST